MNINALNTSATLQAQNLQQTPTPTQTSSSSIDMEKAEEAAREFEAVFISEMMKPMFEGLETDGAFGGGKGEEVFRGIMLQEYGKMMSQTQGIGIASDVKSAMIQMQADADNAHAANNTSTMPSTANNTINTQSMEIE